ncbi:MAG: response regulator receiver protein [Rhodospirillales bacterium]|nr:response regulator receiver protein [Rhodospirillales bacterium]
MRETEKKTTATGKLAGYRVLVVEDEYFIADELHLLLSRNGAEVIGPVSDLSRALALLTSSSVDCAVLDIDLNGRAVFPLIQELKARELPWIYVSGYNGALVPDSLRGSAHIEKPILPEALIASVSALVR